MTIFTIILIENDINTAAQIISSVGYNLTEYRFSIAKQLEWVINEPEDGDIVLINLAQLAELSLEEALTTLQQCYPYAPLVALVSPDCDETRLITSLTLGITDYVELTKPGLLALRQRMQGWHQQWQTNYKTKAIPQSALNIFEETAALYQVASALATTHDPLVMINIVLKEFLRTLKLNQGQVIRFLEHDKKLQSTRLDTTNFPPAETHTNQLFPKLSENPIFQQLKQTHQPIWIDDQYQGTLQIAHQNYPLPPQLNLWMQPDAISCIIIPLKARNDINGVIMAESIDEVRHFQDYEISVGQAMADQLGIALQNISLYEAEQLRRQQSEILREVSFIVGSTLNVNQVLENVLSQLSRVIKYDSAAIHLVEGERRRVIAGYGFENPTQIIGLVFPTQPEHPEPEAYVIKSRCPVLIDDITESYPNLDHPLIENSKSWMGIPLFAGKQITGLITVAKKENYAYQIEDSDVGIAFAQHVSVAIENARLHEYSLSRFEHELAIAREIQETLLPQIVPKIPGLDISGRMAPAREVGGDFFHFFSVSGGGQLGVAVGDVSGKGVPASLYMAVAITAIDIQVRSDPPPGELMNRLNQVLYSRLKENKMNIGLQVAIFEPLLPPEGDTENIDNEARGVLMTTASGGMISPIGATERGCRFLPVSGLPIGALPHPDHVYEDDMFLLDPFTTIIFTTDGIVEAQNEAGELFGFDRLEDTINEIVYVRDAETVAEYIINATQTFMGEAPQSDDMTVVVVVKT